MKKSLSKMNTNELRDLAAELGADIKMVVLKREAKLKLVITFQNDQNKQINERFLS